MLAWECKAWSMRLNRTGRLVAGGWDLLRHLPHWAATKQEQRGNEVTVTLVLSISIYLGGGSGGLHALLQLQMVLRSANPGKFNLLQQLRATNLDIISTQQPPRIQTRIVHHRTPAHTYVAQLPIAAMTERTHRADERRFLDERGSNVSLAPNGLNPATIMEKAVRERIVESYFFKEQCFAVNEADIVNRVVDHVYFIGGTYGSTQKPTPFLCLAFKLLQLAPRDDILREYLSFGGEKFKYLRALAVFYIRLTRRAKNVYTLLEPYLEDRRKLKRKGRAGTTLTYMDEFVDDLLVKDRVCGTSLWKMPSRDLLEDLDELEPRVSPLGDIEDLLEEDEDANMENGHASEDDRGRRSDSESDEHDDEDRARDRMEIDREGTPESRNRSP